MVQPQILEYIKKCKEANVPEEQIKQNLLSVGWNADDVSHSFLSLNTPGIPVPMPGTRPPVPTNISTGSNIQPGTQKGRHSLWDTFQHLLLFFSLYIFASTLAMLVHAAVDDAFEKSRIFSGSGSFYQIATLFSISAVVVSFPVFAFFFLNVTKRTLTNPSLRSLLSRKLLIYLTLIITFLIMIGNLMVKVFSILTGNITVNEAMHFLVTVVFCGVIFGYYVNQVKEDRKLS